jgi:paraquat-inducible protein B
MSKKADPKVIGAFVVGAIFLVAAGLVVFGSGKFFEQTRPVVVFFEGSVGGLNVGAPVNFRGVRVGSVTDIRVVYDAKGDRLVIPVFIEFEPERIQGLTPDRQKTNQELIDMGFRGQLGMQSFVTGQLSVEFDFHPGSPANLVGIDMGYPELPTLPSDLAQLKASIQKVAEKISELNLDELIKKVGHAVDAAAKTMDGAETLINNLNAKVGPVMDELTLAVQEGRRAMTEARSRLEMKEGEVFYTANEALDDAGRLVRKVAAQEEVLAPQVEAAIQSAKKTLDDFDVAIIDVCRPTPDISKTMSDFGANPTANCPAPGVP